VFGKKSKIGSEKPRRQDRLRRLFVSSSPTILFSLLLTVILTASRLCFQLLFFSPGWLLCFLAPLRGHAKPTLPQLNLHNTRVRRKPERLPSSRCIESARTHRARACALPLRASDTTLGLVATDPQIPIWITCDWPTTRPRTSSLRCHRTS
jgi:hypothetical protein